MVSDDPDSEDQGPGARPAHLRPSLLAVVFAGGTVGTAAREGLSLALPPVDGFPVGVLVINVAGAFLLGLLLEALVRRGADVGGRRVLRLGLGTGFCGGFTTYSALASATAVLLTEGRTGTAALYALLTVLVGALATVAGITAGSAGRRRTAAR